MAINYATEEKKNVLIYYYNDERVSIHYKAISTMKILKDKFAFLSISAPSEELLKGHNFQTLPALGGVLATTGDDTSDVKQFSYGGKINFDEILTNMVQLAGKEKEFN